MNTILITGTAKSVSMSEVEYDVFIWASQHGGELKLVKPYKVTNAGYNELWSDAKDIAAGFFLNPSFEDGAYTQFLDHLIIPANL